MDESQVVRLNHEHTEYQWMTFDEAKENEALPGIDDILHFVEKHFAKKALPSGFGFMERMIRRWNSSHIRRFIQEHG
ncbi:hypothetical protein MKY92_07860 [Paenibacillus sp. FSL R5-0623]|uniref:hypothetical protein n=1 Tax=Paenibacillus sp. FSL R5-0623 TaxID=2921651 RepID=UPI0030D80B7E